MISNALLKSELFSDCDINQINYKIMHFSKGDRLPTTLGNELSIGLIIDGRVLVYSLSIDGTAINISCLGYGECFGFPNILIGEDISTQLIANKKTSVAYVPKSCFVSLLENTPGMMTRYAALCTQKIQFLIQKIEFLTIPSCRMRLAAWLLRQNSDIIEIPMPKEAWAFILGIGRASLYRSLRYLQDKKYISVSKKKIDILDKKALQKILEKNC